MLHISTEVTVRRPVNSRLDSRESKRIAKAIDRFVVLNFEASPAKFQKNLATLESSLTVELRHASQRLELQRRCAELYLSHCIENNESWTLVRRALEKLEKLGYSNVERRSHFAVILANYSRNTPEALDKSKHCSRIALSRIRRLEKSNYLRQHMEPLLQGNVG